MKLFVYPTGGQGPGSNNPYVQNMKDSFGELFDLIVPEYKRKLPRMLVFLLNSIKADVYIFNWIEDSATGRSGFLGGLMSLIGLWIVKLRKARIIWVFHNIHPHRGETSWSKFFRRFLFKYSDYIVAHSQEAAKYAKEYSSCPVFFKNHPMKKSYYEKWKGEIQDCDFFIWSDILSYKGVPEFVENPRWNNTNKRLLIIGKSENELIHKRIEKHLQDNIIFKDRFASFSEIAAQCKKSKYVLFPYIGESISSSGVLMDTLLMGGTPVGPNRGAFADLREKGCCFTYNDINELFDLPTGDNALRLDPHCVDVFVKDNSWDSFANWLHKIISVKDRI